jgi:hypothetical protein
MLSYHSGDSTPSLAVAADLGIRLNTYADVIGGGSSTEGLVVYAMGLLEVGLCRAVAIFRAMNGYSEFRIGGTGARAAAPVRGPDLADRPYGMMSAGQRFAPAAGDLPALGVGTRDRHPGERAAVDHPPGAVLEQELAVLARDVGRRQDDVVVVRATEGDALVVRKLDDLGALFVQELMIAVGTEELDLLVPQLVPVAIELPFALRAGRPKYFRHDSSSNLKSEIRNTKSDTNLRSIKSQTRKIQNPESEGSVFRISSFRPFEFVSDFEFRICSFIYIFGTRSRSARGMKSSSRVFSIAVFGTATRAS